jgi:hypothetical protein
VYNADRQVLLHVFIAAEWSFGCVHASHVPPSAPSSLPMIFSDEDEYVSRIMLHSGKCTIIHHYKSSSPISTALSVYVAQQ